MPVWLVTGGSGFLGRHLLTELSANRPRDVSIVAAGRRCPVGWTSDAFLRMDLENPVDVDQGFQASRPACIFHLAGKTPPATPDEFDRLNFATTATLLDRLHAWNRHCRVIVAGSAAELGPVPVEDLPVGEEYPCRPVGPYGESKLRATLAALKASPPIEVVVARVFNPIGPGLPVTQALGRFASLLAEGSDALRLLVGDLDSRRDFIDVRDVAAGLLGLALRGQSGQVYHLGSGQSHAIRDGLDRLIALSGRPVTVEVDTALAQNRGPADSRADVRKIIEHIGWSQRIAWDQSLADLWDELIGATRAGLTDSRPLV